MVPDLSIVLLGYREGERLRNLVKNLRKELSQVNFSFELIIVANYWQSEDDPTPRIAQEIARERNNIHVVAKAKGQGQGFGWDVRCGLKESSGERVVVVEGDQENAAKVIVGMYELMREKQCDICKARRIKRLDGLWRQFISGCFNFFFNCLWPGASDGDVNAKPKMFTREALNRLNLNSNDWFIDAEIMYKAHKCGMKTASYPLVFPKITYRESFVEKTTLWEFAWNLIKHRFWLT